MKVMNILKPITEIMTTDLITVHPTESLSRVKEIFDQHRIHHLPVVEYKKLVGLVSKTDLLYFIKGAIYMKGQAHEQVDMELEEHKVESLMTRKLATLEPHDSIRTALAVFKANLFHALPVIDKGELQGIVTTYDLLNYLADVTISLSDYENIS